MNKEITIDKKQLKQYKQTFPFGMPVFYNSILVRGYGQYKNGDSVCSTEKLWQEKPISYRTGIVVGWKWLSDGMARFCHDEGIRYEPTKSVFAIEVKRGMLNKIDLVLSGSLYVSATIYHIPDRISTMTQGDREWLRKIMKTIPRDSKGRWM